MKRVLVLCLALVLAFSFVSVSADRLEDANIYAEIMKSLNLFKGTDQGFELERTPTRMEALVTLIRLLGKENEALEGTWEHPFTDVAEWADKYAGMAYETGLTKGVSETEFGMAQEATAQQFVTFVLRALGYSDGEEGDFEYANAIDLAKELDIIGENVDTESFLRADMVIISFNALYSFMKGGEKTLAQKLKEDGVFTDEDEKSALEEYNLISEEDADSEEAAKDEEDNEEGKAVTEPGNDTTTEDDGSEYYYNDYPDVYEDGNYEDGYYPEDEWYDDFYEDEYGYDEFEDIE